MTKIVGVRREIQQEEVEFESGVSEGTFTRVGAAINYIMDRIIVPYRCVYGGYFRPTQISNGEGGLYLVKTDSNISRYILGVYNSGTAGASSLNFNVYNASGTLLGLLFSTPPSITSTSNTTNVIIGKDDIDTTPVDIDINSGALTIVKGTLNYTALLAGWSLQPISLLSATNAKTLTFEIRLKEQ